MWPNSQFPADLVTFTEEFLNGKLHFLCGVICPFQIQYDDGTIDWLGLLHVTYWWYLCSLNILKDTSFHFSIDMRYYSVALIKSLSITSLSSNLSSKSTLCNALELVPNLLRHSHPVAMWAFSRFRHCFSPRTFISSQEGTVCFSLSQSLCKVFSISFLRISHNIAEVILAHQCHSLTQQMNYIESSV